MNIELIDVLYIFIIPLFAISPAMLIYMASIKIKLNNEQIHQTLEDQELYATELVEFLVYEGIAFSEAHTTIGRLTRYSRDKNIKIKDMSDKVLKTFNKKLNHRAIKRIMNPEYAVSSKKSLSARKKASSSK